MTDMKKFRDIADEVMSDIKADRELIDRTLKRCTKKRQMPVGSLLAAAACFVLILGVLNISGLLPFTAQPDSVENPGIFTAQENFPLPDKGQLKTWQYEAPDKAKAGFGSSLLIPGYIPEGFRLDKVNASGLDENTINQVVLTYSAGGQYFSIIEEKRDERFGLDNFKTIKVNGTEGYLKPAPTEEDSVTGPDTELHWFADRVHYWISGQITDQEAVKIAESMK